MGFQEDARLQLRTALAVLEENSRIGKLVSSGHITQEKNAIELMADKADIYSRIADCTDDDEEKLDCLCNAASESSDSEYSSKLRAFATEIAKKLGMENPSQTAHDLVKETRKMPPEEKRQEEIDYDEIFSKGSGTDISEFFLSSEGLDDIIRHAERKFMDVFSGYHEKIKDSPFDQHLAARYSRFLASRVILSPYLREICGSELKEILEKDPSNSFARYNYGIHLLLCRRDDLAAKQFMIAYEDHHFRALIPSFPGNPWPNSKVLVPPYELLDIYKMMARQYMDDEPGKAALVLRRGFNDAGYFLSKNPSPNFNYYEEELFIARVAKAQDIVREGKFDVAEICLIGDDNLRIRLQKIKRLQGEGCDFVLAKELHALGLYEEAYSILEAMEGKSAAEYFLLGDCYESAARMEVKGKGGWLIGINNSIRLYMPEAHDAYADALKLDPSNMEYVARLARAARTLEMDDEVANLWAYANSISDGTTEGQIERIKACLGNSFDIKKASADREQDLAKRISILEMMDEEFPGSVKMELVRAYDDYAAHAVR